MALTRIGLNQSINLASNVTGTLPAANGGTGATSFTSTKILQFKQKSLSGNFETSSTSYQDVISDTITPSSSSNKIQIIMDGTFQSYDSSSNQTGYAKNKITRAISGGASTDIMSDAEFMRQYNTGASTGACILRAWQYVSFYDSPSTTSAITYTYKQRADHSSDTVTIYTPANLYLIEVQG